MTIELAAAVASAVSTIAFVLFTTLVILESRRSRLALTAAAVVKATLERSRDNELYATLYLSNLGPAVAERVALTMVFVDLTGGVVAEPHTVTVPALAPGGRLPYDPGLLLWAGSGTAPTLESLAERKLSLRLAWTWIDDRRRLWAPWVQPKHRGKLLVDLVAFRQSAHGIPNVIESDERTILQGIRDDLRMDSQRPRSDAADTLPDDPRIRAHVQVQLALLQWRRRRALVAEWATVVAKQVRKRLP